MVKDQQSCEKNSGVHKFIWGPETVKKLHAPTIWRWTHPIWRPVDAVDVHSNNFQINSISQTAPDKTKWVYAMKWIVLIAETLNQSFWCASPNEGFNFASNSIVGLESQWWATFVYHPNSISGSLSFLIRWTTHEPIQPILSNNPPQNWIICKNQSSHSQLVCPCFTYSLLDCQSESFHSFKLGSSLLLHF